MKISVTTTSKERPQPGSLRMALMVRVPLGSLKGSLASQAGFLLFATVSGYAFSYLYLVFMGRALGPAGFGILGPLVGIFYVASLVGQALRQAIASNVAAIKAKSGESAAVGAYIRAAIKLGILCVLPALVTLIASQGVASFFHLPTTAPVVVLAFALSLVLMLEVVLGLVQGLQEFRALGIIGFLVAQGLKLLLGLAFVSVGWDLAGAVGALLASTAIAMAAGLALVWGKLARGSRQAQLDLRLGPIIIPALVLATFMAMPSSIDVMLVTHFFGTSEAGLYNAVVTLGKVIIFLPMVVSLVMLPKASEQHMLGRGSRKMLVQSLLYAVVLSGAVVLLYRLLPEWTILLFFGRAYIGAGSIVSWYGIAMLVFCLNVVLMHYSLAIGNLRLMLLSNLITLAEVVAIALVHQSLLQVVFILLFGNLLLFLCSFAILICEKV